MNKKGKKKFKQKVFYYKNSSTLLSYTLSLSLLSYLVDYHDSSNLIASWTVIKIWFKGILMAIKNGWLSNNLITQTLYKYWSNILLTSMSVPTLKVASIIKLNAQKKSIFTSKNFFFFTKKKISFFLNYFFFT